MLVNSILTTSSLSLHESIERLDIYYDGMFSRATGWIHKKERFSGEDIFGGLVWLEEMCLIMIPFSSY